jgi:hypothetical protein
MHCTFGKLPFASMTPSISNAICDYAETCQKVSQFGPILRARTQWVKNAVYVAAECFRTVAVVSGFEENLNNAVNHFKLLWGALREKRINALADISWIFFSFQEQKRAWGQSKTSSHRDDRV